MNKRSPILFLVLVLVVGVFAAALLAACYLGASLCVGWLLRRLLTFDMFHGTLLGLVSIGVAAFVVARFLLSMFALLAETAPQDAIDGEEGDEEEDEDEEVESVSRPHSVAREIVTLMDGGRVGIRSSDGAQNKRRRRKARRRR